MSDKLVDKIPANNGKNAVVITKFFDKSSADDDVCIFFEKIAKYKKKENVRKSRKENVICKYFDCKFCKLRKFLHICCDFILGICRADKCSFDLINLYSFLLFFDKLCNFAHVSAVVEDMLTIQPFLGQRRKRP